MLVGEKQRKFTNNPQRRKQLGQSRCNAQLLMCLVMKVNSVATKNVVSYRNLEFRVHKSRKLDVVKQEMIRIDINILES